MESIILQNGKVSIIVPFYNCGKVIIECLNSIKNQTYTNYEVLMIDDGSNDQSKNFALEFCIDKRFKYIYKENSGVSSSRNYGLNIADGEYVSFIDSDDVIHKDYLKFMIDISMKNNGAIVACGHKEFYRKVEWDDCAWKSNVVILNSGFSHENHWEAGVVWGKLFPITCLDGIEFNTNYHVSEDTLFFTQILVKNRRYIYIEKELYGYRMLGDSAIHGQYNERKHTQMKALEESCTLIKPFSEKDYIFLKEQIAQRSKQAAKTYSKNDLLWKEIKKMFRENYKYCTNRNVKQRISNLLFYFFPEVYRWLERDK